MTLPHYMGNGKLQQLVKGGAFALSIAVTTRYGFQENSKDFSLFCREESQADDATGRLRAGCERTLPDRYDPSTRFA